MVKSVAIIGAGPAGLVSAREVIRHGAEPTVFEAAPAIGGVWVYDERVEDDLLGQSPAEAIRCSLYASLRTNIPRDLMAFLDYTFDSAGGGDNEWPRFPHHTRVRQYLVNFSASFGLEHHIRLNEQVLSVKKNGGEWSVETSEGQFLFDAVIVCNGHYAEPRVPTLPGIEHFKGHLLHSHNYRSPEGLEGQRVALWGTSASGFDISNEVAGAAEHTYWCGNAFTESMTFGPTRTALPSPTGFTTEGQLIIGEDTFDIDTFMYCTGYHYSYPFLDSSIVDVDDNWVHPLYQDIVPPGEPTIGFIGLPYLIIPFPMFEIQAKWFVKQLVGDFTLPLAELQSNSVQEKADRQLKAGTEKRHYLRLGDLQFDYYNLLADQCGEPAIPEWFKQTWSDAQKVREKDPVNFRDMPLLARGPTIC